MVMNKYVRRERKALFISSKGLLWAIERLSTASESPGQWEVAAHTLVLQEQVLKPTCLELLSLLVVGFMTFDKRLKCICFCVWKMEANTCVLPGSWEDEVR